MKHLLATAMVVWGTLGVLCNPVQARGAEEDPCEAAALSEGVVSAERGRWSLAEAALRPLYQCDPEYADPELGSVAYWYGRALEGALAGRGVVIWQERLYDQILAGYVDAQLAEAWVLSAVADADDARDLVLVEAVYTSMMDRFGRQVQPHEHDALARLAAHFGLVASADLRPLAERGTRPQTLSREEAEALKEAMLRYWRARDPIPASEINERLIEHIRRIAIAREEYAWAGRSSGLDDRGELYVRFGPPHQIREVDFQSAGFMRRIRREGIPVSRNDFPSNVLWGYSRLFEGGYYLLIEQRRGGHYLEGGLNDLLPRQLRNVGATGTERSNRMATVALEVLSFAGSILSRYSADYSARYAEVQDYVSHQQEEEISQEYFVGGGFARVSQYGAPSETLSRSIEENETADQETVRRREANMPAEAHQTYMEDPGFVARTARFLNDTGETRLEVYWQGESVLENANRVRESAEGLVVDSVRTLSTFVLLDEEYVRLGQSTLERTTPPTIADFDTVSVVAFTLPEEAQRLDVQVDQQFGEGGTRGFSPFIVRGVARFEGLETLRSDGRLEMSDLKPVVPPTEEPYAYAAVPSDMPLALYFEAYGLSFNGEDRVDFRVDYEVTLRREGSLFRRSTERTTRGNLTSTIRGTTTEQFLILNPSEWAGADTAEVAVTVTDRTTGEAVTRTIHFEVE